MKAIDARGRRGKREESKEGCGRPRFPGQQLPESRAGGALAPLELWLFADAVADVRWRPRRGRTFDSVMVPNAFTIGSLDWWPGIQPHVTSTDPLSLRVGDRTVPAGRKVHDTDFMWSWNLAMSRLVGTQTLRPIGILEKLQLPISDQ